MGMTRIALARVLEERGMNLHELHLATGISYSALHAIAKNKTTHIRFETIGALCDALACKPGDLFEYVPD